VKLVARALALSLSRSQFLDWRIIGVVARRDALLALRARCRAILFYN
jgi:hypothetical protein